MARPRDSFERIHRLLVREVLYTSIVMVDIYNKVQEDGAVRVRCPFYVTVIDGDLGGNTKGLSICLCPYQAEYIIYVPSIEDQFFDRRHDLVLTSCAPQICHLWRA